MQVDRTGIILYTLAYEACVDFYGNILGLPILFKGEQLTCFDFGGTYLMVEVDDEYHGEDISFERVRTCLRLNVSNIEEWVEKLKAHQIEVSLQSFHWGTIAKFRDPDGNLCAFRDSQTFDQQVSAGLENT